MTTDLIFDVVDDNASPFFAPVQSDVIDGLLGQYQKQREYIDHIQDLADGAMGNAMQWFFEGNNDNYSRYASKERIFVKKGAIAALNSSFWNKALALTDVYNCMPQKRRDEWNNQIREFKTPEFTEEAVRPTITALLSDRAKFFGERVDGIFRGLSGEHITNRPEGFSKRMIMNYVTDSYSCNTSKAGLINDLRAVIAKFMGRDEPKWNATTSVITAAKEEHTGQWVTLDGGALRIRCYLKGTAHLEVHPEISYRLNQVLAGMHPMAIPSEFRAKPKKPSKEFKMLERPLPFAVVNELIHLSWQRVGNKCSFGYGSMSDGQVARDEAKRVLLSIGAVIDGDGKFSFDYSARSTIKEIIASGCIPDKVAHQFFPTPESVATVAVDMADIEDGDTVLEPSAGQGGIACLLPTDRTTCIEIAPLYCDILAARGLKAIKADFLEWSKNAAADGVTFDRVVMNPPYSEGRWKLHIEHAFAITKKSLTAVLPATYRGKILLQGGATTWSEVFENQFDGTSISVAIMTVSRV